jgi:hypothetical protein
VTAAIEVEAALLAAACFVAALLSGALSWYRAATFTRPQGAVRASVMVFLVASGVNAVGIDLGWRLEWRIIPMLVAAFLLVAALLADLRYEAKRHPGGGPLAPLSRAWRRFRRR